MTKVAIYGKGGIGKSTMSANITAALSSRNLKVLQIGCDPKHDSTRLLLDGEIPTTILDYMKNTPESERNLEDVIHTGYLGCLCTEAGGPEPGVGCAGRGIISSFGLLENLGIDSIEKDVTLYDVLGDVVCGGFAVPIRNEYADVIYVVSSGEFMSIYAANNILRGVSNYNPERIGGIIFNSRGGAEEEERIKKFSEAVNIPIVASFDRSPLFAEAERKGKTVIELFPDSPIKNEFDKVCDDILSGKRNVSKFLSESDLEKLVLGRTAKRAENRNVKIDVSRKKEKPAPKRYLSASVANGDEYFGCSFAGAQTITASVFGLSTVLHSPTDCAQFAFQMTSGSARRRHMFGILPVPRFMDPDVVCTHMDDESMVFGGTKRLKDEITNLIADGRRDIAVITSCASGIIGDDVRETLRNIEENNPGVRIALIESDGDINGDFMQGVIDAGVSLARKFSVNCPKTDSVNIVGSKTISTNCTETENFVREALAAIGVEVACVLPGCGSVEELSKMRSAKYNLKLNPDIFTEKLCQQLEDEYGIPTLNNIVRPGLSGFRSWLGEVAEAFGKIDEYNSYIKEIEKEYSELASSVPSTLKGKRACVVSIIRDIDWLLEAAEATGIIVESIAVVNRSNYPVDTDLESRYDNVRVLETIDVQKETEMIDRISPDIVFTSAMLSTPLVQLPIPLIHEDDPFYAIGFFDKVARKLMAPAEPGWRKDVVRS